MDKETDAMWFQSSWLIDFKAASEKSGDRISLQLSEDGEIISCYAVSMPCGSKPDRNYAKCPTPSANRMKKEEIIETAGEYLTSQAIPFSEEGMMIYWFGGDYWSVFFLRSLAVGDHFSIIVSGNGEVLRTIPGA